MSLTGNTTALRSILDAVNALPAAGGGGTNVQIKTGTFTTSDGSASVNCGFQPDAVEFIITVNSDNEDVAYAAVFAQSNRAKYCGAYNGDSAYGNGYAIISRTSTGFSVSGMNWYTDGWDKQVDNGNTYSYVAIKYT